MDQPWDPDQITTNNPRYPANRVRVLTQGQLNNYTTDDAATLTIKNPAVTKTLLHLH